ncbi:hypothetical protein Tco_1043655 [Tanacetum coccineum]|uniref:Uncharacterized protein n=1 Tax=Tanacetum coccineum TaxID=301880 RepID=A0ABQ5GNB0_9ASTR
MQQKIERLQAQLGDLKGKSKDTPCVSDTLDPLSQKLEDENVSLEFQVLNYAEENEHLKTTYKNLFDSLKVTRAQTKLMTDSLQEKLHDTIYENATLRAQLFDKERTTLLRPKDHSLGEIQRIIGYPMRLRVAASRIILRKYKNTIGIYYFLKLQTIGHLKERISKKKTKNKAKTTKPDSEWKRL